MAAPSTAASRSRHTYCVVSHGITGETLEPVGVRGDAQLNVSRRPRPVTAPRAPVQVAQVPTRGRLCAAAGPAVRKVSLKLKSESRLLQATLLLSTPMALRISPTRWAGRTPGSAGLWAGGLGESRVTPMQSVRCWPWRPAGSPVGPWTSMPPSNALPVGLGPQWVTAPQATRHREGDRPWPSLQRRCPGKVTARHRNPRQPLARAPVRAASVCD